MHLVDRHFRFPARDAIASTGSACARADELPALRRFRGDLEREQRIAEIRVPERAAGEVDAVLLDRAGGFVEAARVFLGGRVEAEIHTAAIAQPEARLPWRELQAISGSTAALAERCARAVDAGKAGRVVCGNAGHSRFRRFDSQRRGQQEFDRSAGQVRRHLDHRVDAQFTSFRIDDGVEPVVGKVGGKDGGRQQHHGCQGAAREDHSHGVISRDDGTER